jgi:hypothetical protein
VGRAVIYPGFNKLISPHRTAVEEGDGSLNKVATLYDIVFYAVGGCCVSDVSLIESETSILLVHFVYALSNEVYEVVFIHHFVAI